MTHKAYLNQSVEVIVDRPLGNPHPNHKDMIYPVNYGYLPNTVAGDGQEIDAYIIGPTVALESFKGQVIGLIERVDDVEFKLIVSNGPSYTDEEILSFVDFTEKYFDSHLITETNPVSFMHHRLNMMHDLAKSLSKVLEKDLSHYDKNYVLLEKYELQNYMIPTITCEDMEIGYNIDKVFIEFFVDKKQALEMIPMMDFEYEVYSGSCQDLRPDTVIECEEETIGFSIYLSYALYQEKEVLSWIKRIRHLISSSEVK